MVIGLRDSPSSEPFFLLWIGAYGRRYQKRYQPLAINAPKNPFTYSGNSRETLKNTACALLYTQDAGGSSPSPPIVGSPVVVGYLLRLPRSVAWLTGRMEAFWKPLEGVAVSRRIRFVGWP